MIVSAAEHAADVDHPVARVEAVGTALRGRPSWDQFDDMTTMAARDAGAQLWTRTDLKPADVDVAELYDGFSFLTMCWLEALGFCGVGESGPFVEGGHRIALDGELPLNTHGGQLSAGRLHGFGFIHEAVPPAPRRGRRPPGPLRPRGRGGRQRRRPGRRAPSCSPARAERQPSRNRSSRMAVSRRRSTLPESSQGSSVWSANTAMWRGTL